jgi:hypothetical protein
VECNTQLHESNARNLSVYLSLSQTRKKYIHLSYYLLSFLFSKIRQEEGRAVSSWKLGKECLMAQAMYTHVSKCRNDKIKGEK